MGSCGGDFFGWWARSLAISAGRVVEFGVGAYGTDCGNTDEGNFDFVGRILVGRKWGTDYGARRQPKRSGIKRGPYEQLEPTAKNGAKTQC